MCLALSICELLAILAHKHPWWFRELRNYFNVTVYAVIQSHVVQKQQRQVKWKNLPEGEAALA